MRRTSYLCAWLAIAVGALVLIGGWVLDVEALRSVMTHAASMKSPTALMFVLTGTALALLVERPSGRRLWVARALAVACMAFSLAVLAEYALHVSLGIDELLFHDRVAHAHGDLYPGRVAPLTAVSFILVGAALLTLDARRRVTEFFTAPVAAIAAASLIGYVYQIPAFYGPASAAKMAIHSAVLFLALSAGALLARPHGRLQAFLTTDTPGGIMARQLVPVAIAVPVLLGWLHLIGEDAQVFNDHSGTWWLSAATIVCLGLVIWRAASTLNRAVWHANRRFETAFEDAPVGIALVDLGGRFLKVNRALSDITGYGQSLVGMHVLDVVHPADHGAYDGALAGLRDGDSDYTAERRYVRRDGTVMWGRHSATLVRDAEGHPEHLIVQVHDITQEREDSRALAEAKQELQGQVERLQDLDRIKEEFVSVVTHELRTPLTSVAGYLDIVLEEDEDGPALDPQHAHQVGVARRNAQRLIDLVEDLLLVRRLEAGREQLSPVAVDLSELTADRLESLAPMASAKEVTIGGDVAPDVVIDADPRRLAQVLDNLLSNAIKYTPAGGDVQLKLADGGEAVTLSVSDTGIGVPEADQAQLFEPFFRASNVSNGEVSGTGLGLIVTRRLVEAHGGSLAFESAEGEGSTFVLTLPARQRILTAPAPDGAAAAV